MRYLNIRQISKMYNASKHNWYCILQLSQVLTSSLGVGVLLSISICAEYLAVTREHLHADYFNCSGNFLRQGTRNCIENTSHKPGYKPIFGQIN